MIPIREQETRGCRANQERSIYVNIEVPKTPPTDVVGNIIIKIQYGILVSVSISILIKTNHKSFQLYT